MASATTNEDITATRGRARIFFELGFTYGLIMAVIWTPRPWQKVLWWFAVGAVLVIAGLSFRGLKAMGLRMGNFLQSLWVVGAALLVAAIAVVVAVQLNTLRLPNGGVTAFFMTYCAYALWACIQQLLLQAFFLPRFLGLLQGGRGIAAALLAAGIFALAHLPNPILTPVTLIWGFAACVLFLRYRNLYPLALAHAIFGITIAITIPGPVDHNMRVGLGYLTYGHHRHLPVPSTQP